jgi:peptidyl-prolyl cis-trans isomerase A (cyclophilin A)
MFNVRSCSLFALCLSVAAGCNPNPNVTANGDPPIPSAAALQSPISEDQAPEKFQAKFETTKGDFVIEVNRSWSPHGADRFYNLVKSGFFDGCAFFRVIEGFMAQFGINGDPEVQKKWRDANIPDDRVVESNKRGYVTFAKSAMPNSRSTQIFINFGDNSRLDRDGFSPFGRVTSGMDVVDSLYNGYGEGFPGGRGPDQGRIQSQGNKYLNADFPKLDSIKKATIVEPKTADNDGADGGEDGANNGSDSQ